MQIALARAWKSPDGVDHQPDDVIEVDDLTGRRLIHDGRARRAPEPAPATPDNSEAAKADVQSPALPPTDSPDTGDTPKE